MCNRSSFALINIKKKKKRIKMIAFHTFSFYTYPLFEHTSIHNRFSSRS